MLSFTNENIYDILSTCINLRYIARVSRVSSYIRVHAHGNVSHNLCFLDPFITHRDSQLVYCSFVTRIFYLYCTFFLAFLMRTVRSVTFSYSYSQSFIQRFTKYIFSFSNFLNSSLSSSFVSQFVIQAVCLTDPLDLTWHKQ